jgi:Flp pilus assembly protein TadD
MFSNRQADEAIFEFQKAIEISGHSAVLDSSLAHAFAISGHREEATRIANNLELRNEKNPSAEANIALIYVGLGDKDQAMMWLNKAYHARFIHPFWCCLPLIRYGPILDSKTCCAASVYQTKGLSINN